MIAFWGELETGILEGNIKWMGFYYKCLASKSQAFKTKYCSVYLGKPVFLVRKGFFVINQFVFLSFDVMIKLTFFFNYV